jgi:hypothetical protein
MYSTDTVLQHNVLDLNVSDVECSVFRIVRITGCCHEETLSVTSYACSALKTDDNYAYIVSKYMGEKTWFNFQQG